MLSVTRIVVISVGLAGGTVLGPFIPSPSAEAHNCVAVNDAAPAGCGDCKKGDHQHDYIGVDGIRHLWCYSVDTGEEELPEVQ